MPTIHVERAFQLTHPAGHRETFRPGPHDVSNDVANHWWVQRHCFGDAPVAETSDLEGDDTPVDEGSKTFEPKSDDDVATMTAAEIKAYIEANPDAVEQVERLELERDKPRDSVLKLLG